MKRGQVPNRYYREKEFGKKFGKRFGKEFGKDFEKTFGKGFGGKKRFGKEFGKRFGKKPGWQFQQNSDSNSKNTDSNNPGTLRKIGYFYTCGRKAYQLIKEGRKIKTHGFAKRGMVEGGGIEIPK